MISVVVPIYNEKDNIESLLKELTLAARDVPVAEIIYVDDGSTDGSFELLKSLRTAFPLLRLLRQGRRSGQSAAIWSGVKAAKHDLIVTMDGDGQNNPKDIARLYESYKAHNPKKTSKIMVLGERAKRHDNFIRRLSSRIANGVRGWLLKDRTRDTGCSLKLFCRQDYLALPYFNHMHRFLPALMLREKVRLYHVPVSHRPRLHGVSKYGTLDRLFVGISDLFGVLWLQKRARLCLETYEEQS